MTQTGELQGLVFRLILFMAYVSPVSRLIGSFNVTDHKHTDNTKCLMALSKLTVSGMDCLAKCAAVLQVWFSSNDIQLNPGKLDAPFFGTSQRLEKSNLPTS